MVLVADLITADDWITEEAFQGILEKTCKIIRERRQSPKEIELDSIDLGVRERARSILNDIVATSMQNQFRQLVGLNKKDFAESAAAALKYFQTIDWLNSLGFEYSTADLELRRQIEGVVESFKSDARAPVKQSRQWWEVSFYPEALGLYAAFFREEPKASFNERTGAMTSAAFMFLGEIIAEVKVSKNADTLFMASEIHSLDMDEWMIHSPSAFRNKISKWIMEAGTEQSDQTLWQENCRLFEARIWLIPEKSP